MWIVREEPINISPSAFPHGGQQRVQWGWRVRAARLTINLQQLLLSDTYLPGALVLAHSLRDAGTTKKLAVLVTLDTVSPDIIKQLEASLYTPSKAHAPPRGRLCR